MKRLLFQIHRWSGVVLALFMALWFFTGLVIVYAEYSYPSRSQQQARGEILAPETGWLSLGEAWERSAAQRLAAESARKGGGDSGVAEARLVRQADQPLWLVDDVRGRRIALSALDGSLHRTSADEALRIAAAWAPGQTLRYLESGDKFALVRNQDNLSPFHRIAVDDGAGTELFISARSGEVVHASTRVDRAFYWAGNWLHLFRFLDATGLGEYRRDVLLWSVSIAFAACVTGMIIGWLRWRPGWGGRPTYSEGRTQPYRQFWFRWHFWSGLIGGIAALLWAFSGIFNGNPWQAFSAATASKEEVARYYGKGIPDSLRDWKPAPLAAGNDRVVTLDWRRLGDETRLLAYTRDGLADSDVPRFDEATLRAAAQRLAGDVPIASLALQDDYDSYYYPRRGRGTTDRGLPVVRVDLADSVGTRLYLNPRDGTLALKQDASRRAYRWLFNALHYWDFGWLSLRPLWDGWMLLWIGFGLVLSVSSVVLGWRRLKITFKPRQAPAKPRPAPGLAAENAP